MSHRLFRLVVGGGAALLLAAVLVVGEAGPASAADITTICTNSSTAGTTITLLGPCSTTEPLTIPDGFTLDGDGNTISATDIGEAQWNGAIVTNAGASMNIQNVTITGPAGGFQECGLSGAGNTLYGIYFLNASGTVDNVTVDHIFQQQAPAFGSCQTGRAIRAESATTPQTVDITNTKVMDYQKTGFEGRGAAMTLNVSTSTAGPPHDLRGFNAQNGVTYVGAAGTVANNTIFGSGDQVPPPPGCTNCGPTNGTAVILFGAHDVTVTNNTMTSDPANTGTDIGVSVSQGSTGITVSFNQIGRAAADAPNDPTGVGVLVDLDTQVPSDATLICNTFSNWNHNIVGAIQIDCTPLPNGAECVTYSALAPSVEGGKFDPEGAFVLPEVPLTWEITTGSLPPGFTMAPDGTITGTPTQVGQFPFTVHVTDAGDPPLTAATDLSITIAPGCETPTTPGSGVSGETDTSTQPLARTGGSSTPLLIPGLISLTTGVGLLVIANRRRSRIRNEASNLA
jgi:hypothetical protein